MGGFDSLIWDLAMADMGDSYVDCRYEVHDFYVNFKIIILLIMFPFFLYSNSEL